jgi:hypothetical protein
MCGDMVRATIEDRKRNTRRVVLPQPIEVFDMESHRNQKKGDLFIAPDIMPTSNVRRLVIGHAEGIGTTHWMGSSEFCKDFSPYGQPGDHLWVRETWATSKSLDYVKPSSLAAGAPIEYAANRCLTMSGGMLPDRGKWRPSIFMPRWASRITLEVTGVRVERVQDISAVDAIAEGIRIEKGSGMIEGEDCYMMTTNSGYMRGPGGAIAAFRNLWDSINDARGFGWNVNPLVWVVEFRRVS